MANNQDIFYLEVNDAVCDANGDLVTEYTFDQIHLKAKYYQLWKDVYKRQVLIGETLMRSPDKRRELERLRGLSLIHI